MKPENFKEEILVVTTTTFSQKAFCEVSNSKSPFAAQVIEKVILNGLLGEMFPELIRAASLKEKLFIWRMSAQQSSLVFELAAMPDTFESLHSIDPYLVLAEANMN
jgi:hypothetical protein